MAVVDDRQVAVVAVQKMMREDASIELETSHDAVAVPFVVQLQQLP
jgi:hypothetical protein